MFRKRANKDLQNVSVSVIKTIMSVVKIQRTELNVKWHLWCCGRILGPVACKVSVIELTGNVRINATLRRFLAATFVMKKQ